MGWIKLICLVCAWYLVVSLSIINLLVTLPKWSPSFNSYYLWIAPLIEASSNPFCDVTSLTLCRTFVSNRRGNCSWVQWPWHVQNTAFHSTPPNFLNLLFFLPLLSCSFLKLGWWEFDIDDSYTAERSEVFMLDILTSY